MLETRGLEKRLETGDLLAGVSVVLHAGDVLAIVGPGQGKSVLVRVLAGLLASDGGEIWVDGVPQRPDSPARRQLGFFGGTQALFPEDTLRGFLCWFALAQGVDEAYIEARVDETLSLTRLAPFADDRMRGLRRGELRRAGLARSLVHAPRLLLLDDPLRGLQGAEYDLWVEILEAIRATGCGIVLAAETVRRIRPLLTHACVLAAGQVLACDRIDALDSRVAQLRCVYLQTTEATRAHRLLAAHPSVFRAHQTGDIIKLLFVGDSNEVRPLLTHLTAQGVRVVSYREEPAYLM